MEELEILSPLHLRFTIPNWENQLYGLTKISAFQFNGGKFELFYDFHVHNDRDVHSLILTKEAGHCRHPIDASVQVESGGRGCIVNDLSDYRHISNLRRSWTLDIWEKDEDDILQAVPNFLNQPLTWIIVLKESIPPPVSASQTNCSLPEDFEMPCMASLSSDFSKLLSRSSDNDMGFMCAGEFIRAHTAIVCARSMVFEAMMRSDMVEGRTRVITIPNVEPDVFKQFLRYLYCGKLDELTCDAALTLYELGDQYAVFGLVKRCSQFLLENMNPENACDALVIADLHCDDDFSEKIITYIVEAAVPLESNRWSAICENLHQLAIKVLREKELAQEKERRRRKRKFSFRAFKVCWRKK